MLIPLLAGCWVLPLELLEVVKLQLAVRSGYQHLGMLYINCLNAWDLDAAYELLIRNVKGWICLLFTFELFTLILVVCE